MNARTAATAVLLAAVAITVACSGVRNRRMSLHDAVTEYSVAIRWGRIQKAARYVPDPERPVFIARKREAWRRLKVHEVEVRSVELSPDQSRARVLLAMTFSQEGNPVIEQHLIEQRWKHGVSGWMLVDRKRVKGKTTAPAKPGDLY